MRRRAALAGLLAALFSTGARRAEAFDWRLLAALDGLYTFAPASGDVTSADLGLRLRTDVLRLAGKVDLTLDFRGRFGFNGGLPDQELRQLFVRTRDLGGRVDLTIGRFMTPGGFWLMADGARLDVRYTGWLSQSVYGGLRSFTTDRRNADLAFENPIALPLAGTSLLLHHRLIDASLTFTYAKEALDLQNQLDATGRVVRDRHVEDEFFLDANILVMPTPTLILQGGASFGSRYDVQFNTQDPVAPATIGTATLGAVSAFAVAEWRPHARIRLQYAANFERIRLYQSQLVFTKADGNPVQAANGSFLDNSVRATVTLFRSLRADLQYRLRWRENTDLQHHAVIGLRGDDLWKGLGGFASVGFDVIQPGVTQATTRALYSGGLSFVKPWLDVRAGILFTDGIGSGLLFSQRLPATMGGGTGAAPTQLFPYMLETNRVAFVRVFGTWRGLFAGLDVEENLDSVQLRAMAQIGYSR